MNRQLAELARLYGIQTSFRNMRDEREEAHPESLLRVLAALGAPVRGMNDVAKALDSRRRETAQKKLGPVLVAWDGEFSATPLKLPRNAKTHIVTEDGVELAGAPRRPQQLPQGYHTLIVQDGPNLTETLVIAAPRKAYFPFDERTWGAFAPMYALRSARRRGAGDLTDFETFANWILGLGGRVVSTLPLLATFLGESGGPFDPSPYAPVSRLFWNEFYADPRRTAEYEGGGGRGTLPDAAIPEPQLIDYRGVMIHRRATLEALAREFFERASGERRAAFDAFVRANPALDDYAQFRAVTDRQGSGWNSWPARLRDGTLERGDFDNRTWQYHRYAQWIVQEQLARTASRMQDAGGALYLDLPLGLHGEGYDTWRYRDLFVQGMAGGAPPDSLFTAGQNWGFPPLHPEITRQHRHAYAIACVRNHLKYGRLLRIDHVMGLHRLFWIPEGMDGSQGVYVEYPAEELYAILCLESHRAGAGIVGENLGTVPPEVNTSMRRHNIQRLYVAQYEIGGAVETDRLKPPPSDAVASLNTHDMPPFRAFLEGRDIEDRLDLGFFDAKGARAARVRRRAEVRALVRVFKNNGILGDQGAVSPEELRRACTQFLKSSAAALTLVNIEDLWLEVDPQNVPATSGERPNWKRRLKRSLAQIQKSYVP